MRTGLNNACKITRLFRVHKIRHDKHSACRVIISVERGCALKYCLINQKIMRISKIIQKGYFFINHITLSTFITKNYNNNINDSKS